MRIAAIKDRWPVVAGLLMVLILLLQPACSLPQADAQGSGCHSDSDSSSEMPDMPAPHQQPCCWAGTHNPPTVPSTGPVISLVAVGELSETGKPPSRESRAVPEPIDQGGGFSPPLRT